MRASLSVVVEDLAIVAAHAFGHDDLALADRAPLAGFLAQRALTALRPALDLEHGERRDQPERGAERAKTSAVNITHENARNEQHAEADPKRRRRLEREHPKRLDVAIELDLARQQVVADGAEQNRILDIAPPHPQ